MQELTQQFRNFAPSVLEVGLEDKVFAICFPDAAQPTLLFLDHDRDAKTVLRERLVP